MKCARKSSFAELVRYLTNPQGKEERVGHVRINNCHSTETEWAVEEVLATQGMNQRAAGDKNFHLLISFAKGEYPLQDMLSEMEKRIVDSIGLGVHQRISVVHHDTDNLHVHVAINKIHPLTHTLREPYQAYPKFGEVASLLELEYGLQPTCHTARKTRSQNRADDMEHHTGIESLMGFIKRECQESLEQAQSWEALHHTLQHHGLSLRARGNGFIITDGNNLAVKASSVTRELSKIRLEQRLGGFRPMNGEMNEPAGVHYLKSPLIPDTTELYARYGIIQKRNQHALQQALDMTRKRRNLRIEAIQQKNRLQRKGIKLLKGRENRKILHALAYKSLQKQLMHVRSQYAREQQALRQKYQRLSWLDWLQQQATNDDRKALQALRSRTAPIKSTANILMGTVKKDLPPHRKATLDSITNQGTKILRAAPATIRDDGKCIAISRIVSAEGLKAALTLAREKFGSRIHITGSDAFKEAILQTAVYYQLPITFADSALEQRRKQLFTPANQPEKLHARTRRSPQNTGTGSTQKRNNHRNPRHFRSPGHHESNPFLIEYLSPTENENRVRNLSELHVVQLARGDKVLLPDHAHHQLERARSKYCHRV
ncbi:conjugal transfer protein TraI [Legionella geestiana]|nr:TraI/MobA(P) family conjugative relaxase [Legionella geestiana]QBS11522.1 conjugal transfer protein TraI [Legionella geestiana]